MTLKEFAANLKKAFPDVYETAAPKGAKRCVVWARYGHASSFGDDQNQVDLPKVQIDVISNILDDSLADDICDALRRMELPYSVQSEAYDDDFAAYRTILQLVVI